MHPIPAGNDPQPPEIAPLAAVRRKRCSPDPPGAAVTLPLALFILAAFLSVSIWNDREIES
jgi:hypothetical protein